MQIFGGQYILYKTKRVSLMMMSCCITVACEDELRPGLPIVLNMKSAYKGSVPVWENFFCEVCPYQYAIFYTQIYVPTCTASLTSDALLGEISMLG